MSALVLGQARIGEASHGADVGLAFASAGINLLYIPTKLTMAVGGLAAGAVIGLLTAGDIRSAYALWVPSAGGTLVVTPANLDGSEPLEFFGSDYSDRPSTLQTVDGSSIYDAAYMSR